MTTLDGPPPLQRIPAIAVLSIVGSLCLSCAALKPTSHEITGKNSTILEMKHAQSKTSSDCLAVCVGMVL
jgi:hypothetical protein